MDDGWRGPRGGSDGDVVRWVDLSGRDETRRDAKVGSFKDHRIDPPHSMKISQGLSFATFRTASAKYEFAHENQAAR